MATPATSSSHDPVQAGLAQLLAKLKQFRPDAPEDVVRAAVAFADAAHEGQLRKSGEPYILHPIEVAEIVAELGMDVDSVVAAILHDVLEDTEITPEKIASQFGQPVLEMVEGVTKLQLNIQPEADARQRRAAETARAAETLRKMLLAMANDFRVMVIKLADRLHNMRTLSALAPEKQTRIANETLDIYAPLAARLGIWQVKWQLEDLSFKTLHPDEFHRISELVAQTRAEREEQLDEARKSLRAHLDERGLQSAKIYGRPKHLFSIYNKMVQQGIPFEEIYDIIALRIIVEETYQCYLALGVVHELWLPMPGLFYDYIASPKPNGYQSLHTKVLGPGKGPLEIQIRTKHMHEVAEYGVAAHWSYKEGKTQATTDDKFGALRRQLFDWSSDNRTSSDFLRSVSTDLFSEQVFAFTPKGDVLDLPRGSTPIDFAFRVHSNLGLTLIGSKINGTMVPLGTEIKNGDVVELVTRKDAKPSLDWLEHAKSPHTKTKLRSYFRKQNKDVSANRGRTAVEKELRSQGLDPRLYLGDDKMAEVAKHTANCDNASDVFARVGEGLTSVQAVIDRLKIAVKEPQEHPVFKTRRSVEPTVITSGVDDVELKRAKCCQPVPGEEVVGYVTRGRGIVIHRKLCPNINKLEETEAERIIPIRWPSDGNLYPINLKIICGDRQGLLMDISTIFGESKTNVSAARIQTMPNHTAEIDVTIDVRDTQHLRDLMAKISNYSDVISILRVMGRGR
ncbi:MAG: bifunctional (p)ppGpp synthetase/guanosine-3',5'-bis(diphosphate) 3'-pyrophosphohydrolase [Armatimonadetes bacterium]|nr:bifunctional (p)ppGpp synthetase/guanosine-3',5'-bis(diphosphate) 3'-pyrophosphohydrolase [Armatimonadota bacterium]